MKNTTRSAVSAAALAAVGLALSAGAASAAVSAPRITNHDQLRASIAAAVAAESANPLVLSGHPAGTPAAAAMSTRPVGIVSNIVAGNPVGKVASSVSIIA